MKNAILMLLLAVSSQIWASASETMIRGKIEQLGVIYFENKATVRLKDVNLNLEDSGHSCGKGNNITIDLENETGRAMYSQLLAAYMAGKNVRIDFSNYTCGLWGTQPNITRVYFGA